MELHRLESDGSIIGRPTYIQTTSVGTMLPVLQPQVVTAKNHKVDISSFLANEIPGTNLLLTPQVIFIFPTIVQIQKVSNFHEIPNIIYDARDNTYDLSRFKRNVLEVEFLRDPTLVPYMIGQYEKLTTMLQSGLLKIEGDLENLYNTGFIDTNIRIKTTRSRKRGERLLLCKSCLLSQKKLFFILKGSDGSNWRGHFTKHRNQENSLNLGGTSSGLLKPDLLTRIKTFPKKENTVICSVMDPNQVYTFPPVINLPQEQSLISPATIPAMMPERSISTVTELIIPQEAMQSSTRYVSRPEPEEFTNFPSSREPTMAETLLDDGERSVEAAARELVAMQRSASTTEIMEELPAGCTLKIDIEEEAANEQRMHLPQRTVTVGAVREQSCGGDSSRSEIVAKQAVDNVILEVPVKCLICSESFCETTLLQNHIIHKHIGCPILFERCQFCNTRVQTDVYEQHVKVLHPREYQQYMTQQQAQQVAVQQQQMMALQQQLMQQQTMNNGSIGPTGLQTILQPSPTASPAGSATTKKRKLEQSLPSSYCTQPMEQSSMLPNKKSRHHCECGTSFEQETSLKIHKQKYCEHQNQERESLPSPVKTSIASIANGTMGNVLADNGLSQHFPQGLLESFSGSGAAGAPTSSSASDGGSANIIQSLTGSTGTSSKLVALQQAATAAAKASASVNGSAEKKYICNVCGRGWNDKNTFRSHKELYCGKGGGTGMLLAAAANISNSEQSAPQKSPLDNITMALSAATSSPSTTVTSTSSPVTSNARKNSKTARVLPRIDESSLAAKLPTMVTSVASGPSLGQPGNPILSIFGKLMELIEHLEPGQQQEFKNMLVKKEAT